MMIANATGNAASSPMPPRISQVSLPSQTGAIVFIISVRASSSRASGDRMPMPRSKPSSRTYMNTPTPRMTVHTGTREPRHVKNARAEHDQVNDHVERDRQQHVGSGERRRNGIARAHQSIH